MIRKHITATVLYLGLVAAAACSAAADPLNLDKET